MSQWLAGEGGLTPQAAERFVVVRRATSYTALLSSKALVPLFPS